MNKTPFLVYTLQSAVLSITTVNHIKGVGFRLTSIL